MKRSTQRQGLCSGAVPKPWLQRNDLSHMLQLRKHVQEKEEGNSRQGIPSKFPVLCKRDKQMYPAREKQQQPVHSLSADPIELCSGTWLHCTSLHITAYDICWEGDKKRCPQSCKTALKPVLPSDPNPGSLKAFRNSTKTQLELRIL